MCLHIILDWLELRSESMSNRHFIYFSKIKWEWQAINWIHTSFEAPYSILFLRCSENVQLTDSWTLVSSLLQRSYTVTWLEATLQAGETQAFEHLEAFQVISGQTANVSHCDTSATDYSETMGYTKIKHTSCIQWKCTSKETILEISEQ